MTASFDPAASDVTSPRTVAESSAYQRRTATTTAARPKAAASATFSPRFVPDLAARAARPATSWRPSRRPGTARRPPPEHQVTHQDQGQAGRQQEGHVAEPDQERRVLFLGEPQLASAISSTGVMRRELVMSLATGLGVAYGVVMTRVGYLLGRMGILDRPRAVMSAQERGLSARFGAPYLDERPAGFPPAGPRPISARRRAFSADLAWI